MKSVLLCAQPVAVIMVITVMMRGANRATVTLNTYSLMSIAWFLVLRVTNMVSINDIGIG